jgi:hypothetical protein
MRRCKKLAFSLPRAFLGDKRLRIERDTLAAPIHERIANDVQLLRRKMRSHRQAQNRPAHLLRHRQLTWLAAQFFVSGSEMGWNRVVDKRADALLR